MLESPPLRRELPFRDRQRKLGLVLVWRETGAIRSARPSHGRAAPTERGCSGQKRREAYNRMGSRRL